MKRTFPFFILLIFLFACSKNDDTGADLIVSDPVDDPPVEDPADPVSNFIPCENGFAGPFPCQGFDLLGRMDLSALDATAGNDIWGWTDTESSREFALIGLNNGTAFVEITDTENLVYLGKLPTATTSSPWRDIKVYAGYAFIGSEAGGHGMQVFDLRKLLSVSNPPTTFTSDARYTGFGNSHNIVINEDSGFAYAIGTGDDPYGGGAHFVNIQDPMNPSPAGGYGASGHTHDAQAVLYNGPDPDYLGREIFMGSNENAVLVLDVSDKQNPVVISSVQYPNLGYTHQGWFTEDHRYFIVGDETDELNFGFNSRTLVFDMTDLDNPVLHGTYFGPTRAIDHNGYVKGNQYFLANYTAGVRVLDLTNLQEGTLVETGYFDSFPSGNGTSFDGAWSVYPFFDSGKIVLSDISSGLFVIRVSN